MLAEFVPYVMIVLAVFAVGLLAWVAVLQVRLARTERRYRRLMTGVEGTDLREALNQHVGKVHEALEALSAVQVDVRRIDRTLQHALQWTGMVRFNPFRYTGGDQSFALAVVDGHGDGVVLTSLHSRENTRVYAKPLHNWESPYSLTEEEEQAIARARPSSE